MDNKILPLIRRLTGMMTANVAPATIRHLRAWLDTPQAAITENVAWARYVVTDMSPMVLQGTGVHLGMSYYDFDGVRTPLRESGEVPGGVIDGNVWTANYRSPTCTADIRYEEAEAPERLALGSEDMGTFADYGELLDHGSAFKRERYFNLAAAGGEIYLVEESAQALADMHGTDHWMWLPRTRYCYRPDKVHRRVDGDWEEVTLPDGEFTMHFTPSGIRYGRYGQGGFRLFDDRGWEMYRREVRASQALISRAEVFEVEGDYIVVGYFSNNSVVVLRTGEPDARPEMVSQLEKTRRSAAPLMAHVREARDPSAGAYPAPEHSGEKQKLLVGIDFLCRARERFGWMIDGKPATALWSQVSPTFLHNGSVYYYAVTNTYGHLCLVRV